MQATQPLRFCFGCHIEKPVEEFSKPQPNRCLDCFLTARREYGRRRYQKHPELRERAKAKYQADPEKFREQNRRYYAMYLAGALQVYGGCCARCGSTDRLEFDHVNGDGAEHRRREHNQSMLRHIALTGQRLPDVDLQLLCHEHHWEKTLAERRARAAARRRT